MKKNIIKFLSALLICSMIFNPSSAFASQNNSHDLFNEISDAVTYLSQVYNNGEGLQVASIDLLNDFNGKPEYLLALFKSGGYAIIFRETGTVIEANLKGNNPYLNISQDKFYAGPLNYAYKNGKSYYNVTDGKEIKPSRIEEISNQVLKSKEKNISDKKQQNPDNLNMSILYPPVTQVRYCSYIQSSLPFGYNEVNTCGSVAAGMMLTCLDIYSNTNIVPTDIVYGQDLYNHLKPYCELATGGSTSDSICSGLDGFFYDNHYLYNLPIVADAKYFYVLHDQYVKSVISSNRTCVVALGGILGSPYGDHMVMAYGYDNYGSYLVHLGWSGEGKSATVISSSWSIGVTFLSLY